MANMSVICIVVLCLSFSLREVTVAAISASDLQDLPETHMNVSAIIRYNGYPAEEFNVVTEDGYVITIQRIPAGRKENLEDLDGPKPVVFLQHGLLCSSSNWVTNLPNESLAFILADAGFDVWLGNVRGNTYGLHHVNYSVHSDEFWDFSWDEMARYDLPAMLKFVVSKTSQPSLYYVGHSQGTLIAFAEFSRNKELTKLVKRFFALGPVTTTGHIESPIKYFRHLGPELEFLFKLLGVRDFLPSDFLIHWLADHVCDEHVLDLICSNIVFLIAGYDKTQLNMTRLPVYVSHTPAGTSVKNMIHFLQMTDSNKFQMFNYESAEKNREHYGQDTPPLYNATAMTVPVALYWAQNDWLADPTDVRALLPLLPNKLYDKYIPKWDHMDFLWGLDAPRVVYYDIIKHMRDV